MSELYESLKSNKYFKYFDIKKLHDREGLPLSDLRRIENNEKANLARYKVPHADDYAYISSYFTEITQGDHVVVQEKLAGSIAHIFIDQRGVFRAYSSSLELNRYMHLQGFYYWCEDNHLKIPKKYWGISIYGEWLVPHHCVYPAECYGKFYVFDVKSRGKFWPWKDVKLLAEECGFQTAPLLYDGEFTSWSDLLPLIGQTKLGGSIGEGVIIKNQSTLNEGGGTSYIKILNKAFQDTVEGRGSDKALNADALVKYEEDQSLVKSVITEAMVQDVIHNLVDMGSLSSPWWRIYDFNSFTITKRAVLGYCYKEKPELTSCVGKLFPSIAVPILQDIVNELLRKERSLNEQSEC